MINKTVANYTIKHLIGSGGMSDVYYAENRLGKKAAIKVLKSELCTIGTIKERFEQEARIMVDIEHKNIRQAFDLDEINGQPAIIMEYLEGHTLKQLIDKGKISDAKAQKYFEQCVLALRVTHAKEIVHRDIKPSNIFITGDDEVKVLDFGIAKVKESGMGTRTNQMLGTPVYMSPEQIKSPKNVNTKSDVYSLAVTFYHALTGKVPYDSTTDSDYEIHTKIVNEDLDLSKLSSAWSALLHPMLIKASNQRIAIDKIGGNSGSDITQYDPDPPTPTPKPMTDPKPEVATTSVSIPHWVYYLIGGIALSVAVMLGIRGCGGDNTSEMVVYEVDGLYGYKDATGSIVIPARYETASPFSGGRAKVTVADSVYYIDVSGVIVELIKPTANDEPLQPDDRGKDESAWQQATRANTKDSYENYLDDFPSGRYVSDARAKIKDIGQSEQSDAERKMDESAWQLATRNHTKSGYEKYLKDYPSGRYVNEVERKLDDIKKVIKFHMM